MFYRPNKLCFLNLFKPSRSEALRFFCCQVGKKGLHAIFCFNLEISRLLSKGDSDTARNVFERMSQRTVVSWNVIISGYAKLGRLDESLNMVSRMHRSNTRLNETTFTCAISCCARYGSCWLGKQLHCLVLKSGFEDFELVGCAMLNMYTSGFEIDYALRLFESFDGRNPLLWSLMLVGFVKCNMMGSALELFERMPNRDVVSWTALISGYSGSVSVVECSKALELFVLLIRSAEADPSEFTYDCVIRVCSKLEHADFGKMVHGLLLRCGFESDCCIKGALIYFYCNCGDLEDARQIYGEMINPCLSTSNAIIAGLVAAGRVGDAEIVFGRMPEPGPFSYNQMIKGYAQEGRVAKAKTLFEKMPCKNLVSLNTMMSVYHRSGDFQQALCLFENIKEQNNTVTWNSMISGYVQNEQPVEALKLYTLMQHASVPRSRSTFSALLRACAAIGALHQGMIIHAQLCKSPFEFNVYVGTSLVDMYAKCGSIAESKTCFLNIASPNVASWTAIINGLAQHGLGIETMLKFGKMLKHGIQPNEVTFVGLILACNREGMVDEGMCFFRSMEKIYKLVPTLEHYACVADLLGRSGCLRDAEEFILDMPIDADSVIWGSLLNACWYFMNLEVGERVAWRLLCLNPKHISTYVVMSNVYAKLGKWDEVVKVRKRLRGLFVKKDPGCSWIEVKHIVHVFCVEDGSHPQKDDIYSILEDVTANICTYSESFIDFSYQHFELLMFCSRLT